jgi:hypothetical protein
VLAAQRAPLARFEGPHTLEPCRIVGVPCSIVGFPRSIALGYPGQRI